MVITYKNCKFELPDQFESRSKEELYAALVSLYQARSITEEEKEQRWLAMESLYEVSAKKIETGEELYSPKLTSYMKKGR